MLFDIQTCPQHVVLFLSHIPYLCAHVGIRNQTCSKQFQVGPVQKWVRQLTIYRSGSGCGNYLLS